MGVKRFIPSDFGSDTLNPTARQIPAFDAKVQTQEKLRELGVPYTLVINGPFLDWGINVGFLINAKEKSVQLYDGGERPWSTTTTTSIGKAAASALKHLDETKDKAVYIQSTSLTQKKLLKLAKEVVGEDGWTENVVSVADVKKKAETESSGHLAFIYWVTVAVFGEGHGSAFGKVDNELLGIEQISDEDVKEIIRDAVSK